MNEAVVTIDDIYVSDVYVGSGGILQPAATTRPASFFQVIDSYNTTNKYIDNSETVNYFIGSVDSGGEVTEIYEPSLFDEETMIFTEPVSGIQYQCTEWKYYYDQRAYVLKLADGSLVYDGQAVEWIGIMYGDDEVIVAGCTEEPTSYSLNLVFSDSYAYVMVAQSECALNGHTYTYETVQEPTCTSSGERKYTCSVCGNEYAEEIPKLDHAYTYTVQQEPDCTTPGIWLYTCSLCGDQYTEQVDALGHDWLATENTPTSYALPEDAACPDCGSTDFDFTLDQVSETYSCTCSCGAEWTEQAVVTYGQTTYTCSRCGESYVESEDPDSGLFASIGNFIANGIDWIVDKLVQLIDSIAGINEIFTEYVEQMKEKAGEYPAFISAFIAIMPEDLMTVFWFGVIAAVVLAVWKKWFN